MRGMFNATANTSFQMITLYAQVGSVEPVWVTERKLHVFHALDLDAYARLLDH